MDPDARVYFNSKRLSAGDTNRGKKNNLLVESS